MFASWHEPGTVRLLFRASSSSTLQHHTLHNRARARARRLRINAAAQSPARLAAAKSPQGRSTLGDLSAMQHKLACARLALKFLHAYVRTGPVRLRSGPRDCSHSPHTLYIKNKIKNPSARPNFVENLG